MLPELIVAVTVLANLFIAFVVYRKNSRSITHILLTLMSLTMAAWTAGNFLALSVGTELERLFWVRSVMAITAPFGPLLFLLAYNYPRPDLQIKRYYVYLIIFCILVTIIFAYSPWMFESVKNIADGDFILYPGLAIIVYASVLLLFMTFGFIKLIRKYKNSSGTLKKQLGLFLWGTIISFSLMIATNFLAVILFQSVKLTFLGPPSTLIMITFMAYAIVKHGFLDIRFVLARSVSYSMLTISVVIFYTLTLFAIGHWVFPTTLNASQQYVSIVLTLIIAFTLQPLRQFWEKITDRFFFSQTYDPEQLITELSRAMSSSLDLKQISSEIFNRLINELHLDSSTLLLLKNGSEERMLGSLKNTQLLSDIHQSYDNIFKTRKKYILFDDIPESHFKKTLRNFNIGCVLPLSVKGDATGALFIGNKKTGDIYSNQDILVLTILAPQIAIAIQNARQYEEIQQFSEELKLKVEEATQRLRQTNAKLKDIDKRKDEFISVAAHDLRAPLTAVKGYLSMIMDGDAGKLPKKAEEFIQGALEGAEREIRLVNNMLNVSRIEENRLVFEMANINLAEVVREGFSEFKLVAKEKGIKYELNIANDIDDLVNVDRDRIHEVIANLISNSIKYTDLGSIVLKLTNPRKGYILFTIQDSGRGLTDEEKDKLFTKFYRAQSSAGVTLGTGLGLYITKLLIEKFDGTIKVESELGKGSVFSFELPVKK